MEGSRPTARSNAAPVAIAVTLLLAAPLLYALSAGPAIWLTQNGYTEPESLEIVYIPLGFVMDQSRWFDVVMQRYLALFLK